MKYSCGLWGDGGVTLAASEDAMLAVTTERAGLADGQRVLELGCGWGSMTLWMAERFPRSRITAVSNSASQRAWIEGECARRGLANVRVLTADMNDFRPDGAFDRVVSIEMLEHMRNHGALLRRIEACLAPGGLVFAHVFAHRRHAYLYEDAGPSDWMARHFFSGGMMPSADLLQRVDSGLRPAADWTVSGTHYARTAEAWLARLDRNAAEVRALFARVYGAGTEARWFHRWRVFFLSCAELFGYRGGEEWLVRHVLLAKP
jgi:cyclopropane-fatty-acyl-phospholipid synthase